MTIRAAAEFAARFVADSARERMRRWTGDADLLRAVDEAQGRCEMAESARDDALARVAHLTAERDAAMREASEATFERDIMAALLTQRDKECNEHATQAYATGNDLSSALGRLGVLEQKLDAVVCSRNTAVAQVDGLRTKLDIVTADRDQWRADVASMAQERDAATRRAEQHMDDARAAEAIANDAMVSGLAAVEKAKVYGNALAEMHREACKVGLDRWHEAEQLRARLALYEAVVDAARCVLAATGHDMRHIDVIAALYTALLALDETTKGATT